MNKLTEKLTYETRSLFKWKLDWWK